VLLCVQIVLLGVCISPSPAGGDQYEQLSLQPMPLYSLPSDNVIMTCVASSAAGRLFMGGSDGNLYEIQYEATDTWWQRRCSKVRGSSSCLHSFHSAATAADCPFCWVRAF
jgi:nuclear pore complex protein Nup155